MKLNKKSDSHTITTLVVTQVDEYKNVMLQPMRKFSSRLVTTYTVPSCMACANNFNLLHTCEETYDD